MLQLHVTGCGVSRNETLYADSVQRMSSSSFKFIVVSYD